MATKSSMTSARWPGAVAARDMQSSSPATLPPSLYSLKYSLPVTALGSLPFFRIITNGFFNASAIGGPRTKPRASRPATKSMSMSR